MQTDEQIEGSENDFQNIEKSCWRATQLQNLMNRENEDAAGEEQKISSDDIKMIVENQVIQSAKEQQQEEETDKVFLVEKKEKDTTIDLIDYYGTDSHQKTFNANTSDPYSLHKMSDELGEGEYFKQNKMEENKVNWFVSEVPAIVNKHTDLLMLDDTFVEDNNQLQMQQKQQQEKHQKELESKQQQQNIVDNYIINESDDYCTEIKTNIDEQSAPNTQPKQQQQQSPPIISENNMQQYIIQESDDEVYEEQIQSNKSNPARHSLNVEDILNMANERMFNRIILISEPELITEGYLTTYKLYKVKSKEQGSIHYETEVLRRFSDFEWLYNELVNQYGGYLIPLLPEKNILTKFNVETPNFTKDRQRSLEFFLQKLLEHPKLHQVAQLKLFICARNEMFSLVKGEAESKKTIEYRYQNILGSVKNYFSSNIVPFFGSNNSSNTNTSDNKQGLQSERDDSEIDRQLNGFEQSFASISNKVKALMKICLNQNELIEEEVKSSNSLNYHYALYNQSQQQYHTFVSNKDSSYGMESQGQYNQYQGKQITNKKQQDSSKEALINQNIINLKEDALFQWQMQFQPQLEVWYRNCLAAEEALSRRKEIVNQIMKDSKRIQELSLLNKKNNNQRDTEMDILQNSLQKNKQRLNKINETLVTEIQDFHTYQQTQFNNILSKFQEIQKELFSKQTDIYEGRNPSLI